MQYLKWTNWPIYQRLTKTTLQQVHPQLAQVILKCGFSWSPAPSPSQPILLTSVGTNSDLDMLIKLGFEFEDEDPQVNEPTLDNGFNYHSYLDSAWRSLGVKTPQTQVMQQKQQQQQMSVTEFMDKIHEKKTEDNPPTEN